MIDIVGLYEGLMLQASYAGIGFWMVDSRDDPGRRVERFLFPGQDRADFQDLGQDDGQIVINGLYVGDDYTALADRLRTAFQTPGPATLVHPWLGEVLVIQAPGKRPTFNFRQDELRVVRFSATFCRYYPRQPAAPDTLTSLLNALDDLRTQANQLLATVLAPIALTVSAIGYVERFASLMETTWLGLVAAAPDPQVATMAAAPIAALGVVNALPADSTYPATVGAALAAPSVAIAGTSTPVIPAAVAPGGSLAPAPAVDGRITAGLILSAVATMAGKSGDPAPGGSIDGAAQMLALADAISATSTIVFDSQQEAMQWQAQLLVALDAVAAQAAQLAAVQPTAGGSAWRSIIATRAALAADMTATIGRLPSVTTFTAPTSVPVWLLAQYLSGDRPDQLVGVYLDLVRRNGIRNPAVAPAGPLEVLLA